MTRSILATLDRITAVNPAELGDLDELLVGCTCAELLVHPVVGTFGQLVEIEVAHDKGCPRLRQTR